MKPSEDGLRSSVGIAFLIIALAKLLFSGLFSSDYVDKIFVPFIELFWVEGLNAWRITEYDFPYPPAMALFLSGPVKLATFFKSIYVKNLIFHTPLVFCDLLIVNYLRRLLSGKEKEILVFFSLSPILIYSTYVHSQLDLVPTSAVFASVFYLLNGRSILSFLLLGLSISLKWHTVVALPFYVVFLLKKNLDLKFSFKLASITFIPLFLSLAPFGSIVDISNVFMANERNLIFESFLGVMDLKIYLFPLLYIVLLGRSFGYTRIDNEIFMGFLSILFMTFVVAVYPNPGWFVWSLPFLSYSFIKNSKKKGMTTFLYVLISIAYMIFFLFFYKHPFNEFSNINVLGKRIDFFIENKVFRNLSFSVLVSFLALGIYATFKSAINNSLIFKRRFESFLIGIAGDSSAGKSTLLNSLESLFGSQIMIGLEGDAEHKWERGHEMWNKFTHLNPRANKLHNQLIYLIRLKQGKGIKRSVYNHISGKFESAKDVLSKEFITISGLHPFYLKGARDSIDLKIFIDTEEYLRKHWKLKRDIHERGYSKQQVLAQLENRKEDSKKFIQPQLKYADIIIKYSTQVEIDLGETELDECDLIVDYALDIDFPFESLLERLEDLGVEVISHEFDEELVRQHLSLRLTREFHSNEFQSDFEDFFQAVRVLNVGWLKGIQGLNQVVILHCIANKYLGLEGRI